MGDCMMRQGKGAASREAIEGFEVEGSGFAALSDDARTHSAFALCSIIDLDGSMSAFCCHLSIYVEARRYYTFALIATSSSS